MSYQRHSQKPFTIFADENNIHFITDNGLDLINKILVYDHRTRLTALEAMQHPFFDGFRD
jgi:casein kinase II subunit alpha